MHKYLVFMIEGQRFALDFGFVNSVVNAAELTPFHTNSETVLGLLNLHGELISVLNMRRILRLVEKALEPSDQFVICEQNNRRFTLAVDRVIGIQDFNPFPDNSNASLACVRHVVSGEEDPIFVLQAESLSAEVRHA